MILVWGLPDDGPARAVVQSLSAKGAAHAFVDQRFTPQTALSAGNCEAWDAVVLSYRGDKIPMDRVSALYLRCSQLPQLEDNQRSSHAHAVMSGLLAVAEALPALVVNRPSAMTDNDSKPWQARWIGGFGFKTPPTLVTTDPSAVRSFLEEHGRIIYKSVSGTRSIVREFGLADLDRLDCVTTCPTQFQALLTGTNYRVHVVGTAVFAARITTTATDYRYPRGAGDHTEMTSVKLPDAVTPACVRMASEMGLPVAGIDLMQTTDGGWWCFEVNPSPAFTWFAQCTGQPIADAVADLLISGAQPLPSVARPSAKQTTTNPPLSRKD